MLRQIKRSSTELFKLYFQQSIVYFYVSKRTRVLSTEHFSSFANFL